MFRTFLSSSYHHCHIPRRAFYRTMSAASANISVSAVPPRWGKPEGRPAHHVDDTGRKFCNPWPSFQLFKPTQLLGFMWENFTNPPKVPALKELTTLIPSQTPTWGTEPENKGKIKATWLGHAAFLVELPAPEGAVRGPRILFDPVLVNRCSPSQWAGPARYTQAPCATEDIPAIDVIAISHNHYDHMDETTLKTLRERHSPQLFIPLGNEKLARSLGYGDSHAHSLDWYDTREISLALPASAPSSPAVQTSFSLTFTPTQHQANRGMFDRWYSLWGSWALEGPKRADGSAGAKVWFAGDTGYRTVGAGQDENEVPVCPAFKEIGERFGGFDLALLPIGAYQPRAVMSCVHASPSDAVRIFQDVRAKRALAMHWGTWILTTEPIMEPPQKLREACDAAGITKEQFNVSGLGETRFFDWD